MTHHFAVTVHQHFLHPATKNLPKKTSRRSNLTHHFFAGLVHERYLHKETKCSQKKALWQPGLTHQMTHLLTHFRCKFFQAEMAGLTRALKALSKKFFLPLVAANFHSTFPLSSTGKHSDTPTLIGTLIDLLFHHFQNPIL
jgi:hypothetical protein